MSVAATQASPTTPWGRRQSFKDHGLVLAEGIHALRVRCFQCRP